MGGHTTLTDRSRIIDGEWRELDEARRRVALHIDEHEADALMSLLLHAGDNPRAPAGMMDHLLCLLAEAQRELSRPIAGPPAVVAVGRVPGPTSKVL